MISTLALGILGVVCVVQAVLGYRKEQAFLRELKDFHAAALQSRGHSDARRVLTKREENERAMAALQLQKELIESGGVFPDPNRAEKPIGI